jgi:hypothetical protein
MSARCGQDNVGSPAQKVSLHSYGENRLENRLTDLVKSHG